MLDLVHGGTPSTSTACNWSNLNESQGIRQARLSSIKNFGKFCSTRQLRSYQLTISRSFGSHSATCSSQHLKFYFKAMLRVPAKQAGTHLFVRHFDACETGELLHVWRFNLRSRRAAASEDAPLKPNAVEQACSEELWPDTGDTKHRICSSRPVICFQSDSRTTEAQFDL